MPSLVRKTLPVSIALLLAACVCALAAPIRLRSGAVEPPAKKDIPVSLLSYDSVGEAVYLVQFAGPPMEGWKAAVEGMGAKLGDYVPENAYIARMNAQEARNVFALEFVAWVQRLLSSHRYDKALAETGPMTREVVISLFPGTPRDDVEKVLRRYGGKLLDKGNPSQRLIKASLPPQAVEFVARVEGVQWIEEWVQPRPANNVAQSILGVPALRQRVSLFGAGQIVAFADSGLDTGSLATLSADFAGRVYKAYGIRRPGVWSDLTGHGTHVLGVAVGSGVLSGSEPSTHTYDGSFAGVAPEAELIIQSIGDSSPFVYPPLELSTMFQPAYDDGARVHSNSWGSPSRGAYTVYSQQVDDYLWNHKDFVLVCSAGNDGRDGNSDGVTDPDYVYAPGTAKNAITVGATESLRTGTNPPDGWITTYGAAWPADFPVVPLNNDYISDNPQGMVAWSSRGPCDDGRIKPDICAPGTNIISNRSHADGVASYWWRIYDANYVYWGGTSMATPMVSGAAALVRECYIKNWGIQPSAALVKATLLNGAHDITPGQYTPPYPPEAPPRPNSIEGWGRLDLSASLEPQAPKVIEFVDEAGGLSTGESRDYQYQVLSNGIPLAVTLVWTDPPASLLSSKQLVNDLNLTVTGPNSFFARGNGVIDNTNNVEGVDIASPTPGTYHVTVSGFNVPQGPQPYALVISGALPGGYISGVSRTASGNPIAGVSIAITDGSTKTTATGADGAYTVHCVPSTYTVTPSKTGWTFTPPTAEVVVAETGVTGVDFVGSAPAGHISGTVTQVVGGTTNYILESPHPYQNYSNLLYTITGHPSATKIRVHFNEIAVEDGYDFVKVEKPDGTVVNSYTGDWSDQWSNWVTGNTIRVRLVTDDVTMGYGFHIDGYETDTVSLGGLAGVTVESSPGSGSVQTGPGGTYSIPGLEPVAYTVTPSLAHWRFLPSERSADVPPGATATGIDFQAFPPGSVAGSVTTGVVRANAQVTESPHPYDINSHEIYPVVGPSGTTRIRVHFASQGADPGIETEAGFDFVYVTDANNNVVDTFSGTYSDVWSSWVQGDRLNIVMESDDSNCLYGFYSDRFEAVGPQHGVQSVTLTAQPGNLTSLTNGSGVYTINSIDTGLCTVAPSKAYWTFDPISTTVNVVAGVTTTQVDFYGTVSTVPGIAFAKSLPDGEEVLLPPMVVTAGTAQISGAFYIEEANRTTGIRVATSESIDRGDLVTVRGILRTDACERYIEAVDITIVSAGAQIPDPIGFNGASLGGGPLAPYVPGVTGSQGANNVGLLVRTWGRVRSLGTNCFYIDDGSRMPPPASGEVLVKVSCPPGISIPDVGWYVAVTGICSSELSGADCIRVVRVRDDDDLDLLLVPR